jgi:hypothetical protein
MEVTMSEITLLLMNNGWAPPVNWSGPPPPFKETIYIGKRLTATFEGTDEEIAAIRNGIEKGWFPEFWAMKEI